MEMVSPGALIIFRAQALSTTCYASHCSIREAHDTSLRIKMNTDVLVTSFGYVVDNLDQNSMERTGIRFPIVHFPITSTHPTISKLAQSLQREVQHCCASNVGKAHCVKNCISYDANLLTSTLLSSTMISPQLMTGHFAMSPPFSM
jgi:hypothetical protein